MGRAPVNLKNKYLELILIGVSNRFRHTRVFGGYKGVSTETMSDVSLWGSGKLNNPRIFEPTGRMQF